MGNPAPKFEHVLSLQDKRRIPKWARGWSFHIADQYRLLALRELLPNYSGRLLDYGCGDKKFQPVLQHNDIQEWVGVDLDQRTSGNIHSNQADLYLTEKSTIPCADESFDVVLSTQVFEHVPNMDVALSEISRVLKPGGKLIATVPMTSPLHEEPFDFRRFTPYGMAQMGAAHGLELIRVVALGGPISTIATQFVIHLNPLERIPVLGKFIRAVVNDSLLFIALLGEETLFRLGMHQCDLTLDYLFILQKERS